MIFVTGGTGMLGSYLLLELLKSGKDVVASKRKESSTKITKLVFDTFSDTDTPNELFSKIKWVDIDLFSQANIEEELSNISEVYHCAAYISNSLSNKNKLIENNQTITQNIVNASINCNIDKFCHVSSISALGNSSNGELISEKTFWKEQKNNSTYSTSKYLSEVEVWRGIAEGLNAVIINPSVILGVGDWEKGSANLFAKVKNGLKYYTKGSSGFVNAKDVAKIMIQLMDSKEDNFKQGYIVSAENLDFKQLFDKIAKSFNIPSPNIYATNFLTQLAWRLEWIRSKALKTEALITKESARTAHKQLAYNNKKLIESIDYKYETIDDTISEIVKVYNKTNIL